eukprot:Amastigsp_a180052_21.p6 type:complete len:103 gc:universal Amastigsp_a180052_21:838-1146(+)
MRSKILSSPDLPRRNEANALCTASVTVNVFEYGIESLPRNSSLMRFSSRMVACWCWSEQVPNVSASSSLSFSLPTRSASLSMRYTATAICFSFCVPERSLAS